MEKVKSVWFLSLEKYALFGQGSGVGVGRGKGRERGDIINFPYGPQSSVSPTGHSGNAAFLAQYLVAQRDGNRTQASFPGLFILPKQLDHIKRQQLKDVLSNPITQCLEMVSNSSGPWSRGLASHCGRWVLHVQTPMHCSSNLQASVFV